jgi:hypothetical protein
MPAGKKNGIARGPEIPIRPGYRARMVSIALGPGIPVRPADRVGMVRNTQRRTAPGERNMSNKLTRAEEAICARLGLKPADFVAARDRSAQTATRRPSVAQEASAADRILANLNIEPDRFLAASLRRAANSAGAPKGRQVVGEALDAMDDNEENPKNLVGQARDAIDAFLNSDDPQQEWDALAQAGALLTLALERLAPAFADRTHLDDG